ncbi:MAG: PIN domain-containing protein [Nanoarchaeota archaeon]
MIAVDTNILVYAFDDAYPKKNEVCRRILMDVFGGKLRGAVTCQVLAEFATAVTRKIERPISKNEAFTLIEAIQASDNWTVFPYSANTVLAALQSTNHFWDALIAETLNENHVSEILTENVKDFQGMGLKVKNPFKN